MFWGWRLAFNSSHPRDRQFTVRHVAWCECNERRSVTFARKWGVLQCLFCRPQLEEWSVVGCQFYRFWVEKVYFYQCAKLKRRVIWIGTLKTTKMSEFLIFFMHVWKNEDAVQLPQKRHVQTGHKKTAETLTAVLFVSNREENVEIEQKCNFNDTMKHSFWPKCHKVEKRALHLKRY